MNKYNLLDCTLRDGGYINKWKFDDASIKNMIEGFLEANIDFIEIGYLNPSSDGINTTQFPSLSGMKRFLPSDRRNLQILVMADVAQVRTEDIVQHQDGFVDGVRVVFYKHQVKEALLLGERIKQCGYLLFMQPMVTIDYTLDEYAELAKRIEKLKPYAISIVDSFGYMLKEDFRKYFHILDNIFSQDTLIGFHSHNNMNLAFLTAQDILEYNTSRGLIIDASLYGMGRGAGNLNTELITNYYNMTLGKKYNQRKILELISRYIMDIYKTKPWGYSPYFFITGLYHYHPNFASYLLEDYDVSVEEFEKFIRTIPDEMRTKCRKPYVIEMWKKYREMVENEGSCNHANQAE